MTNQQKEIIQLKREIRKLERDKRLVEDRLRKAENGQRYWHKEYHRLLEKYDEALNTVEKPKTKSIINPRNPDPINRV